MRGGLDRCPACDKFTLGNRRDIGSLVGGKECLTTRCSYIDHGDNTYSVLEHDDNYKICRRVRYCGGEKIGIIREYSLD